MLIRYQYLGRWYEAEWPPQPATRAGWGWWVAVSLIAWTLYWMW